MHQAYWPKNKRSKRAGSVASQTNHSPFHARTFFFFCCCSFEILVRLVLIIMDVLSRYTVAVYFYIHLLVKKRTWDLTFGGGGGSAGDASMFLSTRVSLSVRMCLYEKQELYSITGGKKETEKVCACIRIKRSIAKVKAINVNGVTPCQRFNCFNNNTLTHSCSYAVGGGILRASIKYLYM